MVLLFEHKIRTYNFYTNCSSQLQEYKPLWVSPDKVIDKLKERGYCLTKQNLFYHAKKGNIKIKRDPKKVKKVFFDMKEVFSKFLRKNEKNNK